MGLESPPGLLKTQSSIAGVKTPRLEVFFIPLERSWSVDVQNSLAWVIWTFVAQVMVERWVGSQNCWPLKVGNRPDPGACRQNVTHRWKDLKESYKFASDLIPIGGLSEELWVSKVPGVQTGTIPGQFRDFHLGVPGQTSIWMWPPWSGTKYTIWGNVVASLESGPWWVKWVQSCPWLVLALRVLQNVN
jgi:hypothetical protein